MGVLAKVSVTVFSCASKEGVGDWCTEIKEKLKSVLGEKIEEEPGHPTLSHTEIR